MAKAAARGLRAEEVAFLRPAFGDRLPYADVRLVDGAGGNPVAMAAFRNGNTAITLRRTVYFGPGKYSEDYARAGPHEQGLLAHEMTHVWQYAQLGVVRFLARYAREFASVRGQAHLMYRYEAGVAPFAEARLEAQAQMVGDYMFARLVGDQARMARLAVNLRGSGFFGL